MKTDDAQQVDDDPPARRPWKLWQMGRAAPVDRLRALPPVKRQAVFDMIREKHGAGALVDLRGDHPDLPPCEHDCTHRYETCVRESAVSGRTLLDCINDYYECADRCPKRR